MRHTYVDLSRTIGIDRLEPLLHLHVLLLRRKAAELLRLCMRARARETLFYGQHSSTLARTQGGAAVVDGGAPYAPLAYAPPAPGGAPPAGGAPP